MANLKEIRGRISSISSTMQITNAMKMVSVAKLKKAQNLVSTFRPYAKKLNGIIESLCAISQDNDVGSVYSTSRDVRRVLLIAITSNRGLAGAFNSSVIKEINNYIEENPNICVEILTIGKKGFDAFKNFHKIYENRSDIYDSLNFENISEIIERVMMDFRSKVFDEIHIVYNKFINAAIQEVQIEKLLPISLESKFNKSDENGVVLDYISDYILEPSREEILETLIPKAVKIQSYKAILDSLASEHGARMTAMHKATDNAQELKNELAIFYNKARQTAITNEILEIVSGAEAMKNS